MTRRRSPSRVPEPRRRSVVIIVLVLFAAIAVAVAVLPGALAPSPPLDCPYGEVILNGVDQCLPSRGP